MVLNRVQVTKADCAERSQLEIGAHDNPPDVVDVQVVPFIEIEQELTILRRQKIVLLKLRTFFFVDFRRPLRPLGKDDIAVDVPVLPDEVGNEERLELD